MDAKGKIRFDIDAVRKRAGDKVFARGVAYHGDGEVQILMVTPHRVLAQVTGTEDYRTELTGRDQEISGACSCRAFEDYGFCKHMVAVALAANDLGPDEADGGGALERIRNHLKDKGVDALVDIIVGLAEQDLVLLRKLDGAAAARNEDEKTLGKRLRKAIDSAARTRDVMEVPVWADNVDAVLDTIADLASGARAGLAFELVNHAADRIGQAIEEIDDSDGDGRALLERARDIHLAAVREIKPDPVELARDLFAREMADEYVMFDGAMLRYADVLGETGLAEYRRLADEAWAKSLPSVGEKGQPADVAVDRYRVMHILDFFAERDGDVDARIALRASNLSSQLDYLQLAKFCLSHGRTEQALQQAEEGLWIFEDGRQVSELVLFTAELLSKAGRKADAETHLWRLFSKHPSLDLYGRLCSLGGAVARERAMSLLEEKLSSGKQIGWSSPADLLIRVRMQEKMFDAAWGAVAKHGASMGLKQELAGATEATHPREVLEVYAACVNQLANAGSDYEQAAKLVTRMAKLRPNGEQVAYVLGLKQRFGRRRNFMKLLG